MGDQKSRSGIVYSDVYLQHKTGGHPESSQRLVAIMEGLEKDGLIEKLVRIEPRMASPAEIKEIHSSSYIEWVEEKCRQGARVLDFGDTVVSERSYEAAIFAAGGILSAVDAILAGEISNCFCAVRPPGHHALYDRAMGFCLFNNVAIGARYAQKKHGIKRVLIVDWDVHHGNGTQETFYEDPTVFYFSTHQFPHYPGSGSESERGSGEGRGFTLNVPLGPGGGDKEYIKVFNEKLVPAMEDFKPEFVFISAGFDAHRSDLLSSMSLTEEGYGRLTAIVLEIAEKYASGRLISILEGGYNLQALANSVVTHIQTLIGSD